MALRLNLYKRDLTRVPVRCMHDILHVDTVGLTVRCEPFVTVAQLTSRLLPLGLTLPCIPELDDLTVGTWSLATLKTCWATAGSTGRVRLGCCGKGWAVPETCGRETESSPRHPWPQPSLPIPHLKSNPRTALGTPCPWQYISWRSQVVC